MTLGILKVAAVLEQGASGERNISWESVNARCEIEHLMGQGTIPTNILRSTSAPHIALSSVGRG